MAQPENKTEQKLLIILTTKPFHLELSVFIKGDGPKINVSFTPKVAFLCFANEAATPRVLDGGLAVFHSFCATYAHTWLRLLKCFAYCAHMLIIFHKKKMFICFCHSGPNIAYEVS